MAETLREYFVKLLFKSDSAGASKAQKQLDHLKHSFEELGRKAFIFNEMFESVNRIVEPFKQVGEAIARTAEEADALGDLSERTGIATEALEEYAYMAKIAGSSSETLVTGLRILEKNMGMAASGGKEQAEAFSKLGISLHGANGKMKTTDELLPELSKAFQKLPDHASKTAYAMKLFGRSGQELLPLLERGPEDIENMRHELKALGGETSGEFLESAAVYADNVHKVSAAWKGVRQALSGPLLKMINDTTNAMLKWWKANGELVRGKLSEWIFQLRTSVEALWGMVVKIAPAFLLLAAALNVPLLVMIGMKLLIALLVDDFANWMADNDSLIGRAIKNWDEWLDKLTETHPVLAALLDAFARSMKMMGELMKSMLATLDVLLDAFIDGGWDGFVKELSQSWDIAIQAWKEVFSGFWDWLGEGMRNIPGIGKLLQFTDDLEQESAIKGKRMAMRRAEMRGSASSNAINNVSSSSGGNSAQANITVNVPAGQDPKQTAEEISRMWDEKFDSEIRSGFNQLVPEEY